MATGVEAAIVNVHWPLGEVSVLGSNGKLGVGVGQAAQGVAVGSSVAVAVGGRVGSVVGVAVWLGVSVGSGEGVGGKLAGWHAAETKAKVSKGERMRVFMRSL